MLKNFKIFRTLDILKIRDSNGVAHFFSVYQSFPIVFIFKNERVTAIPANPYFWPKLAEQDVTLKPFTAELS